MYDVRQFRPTLYFLIMLGMTGFAVATGSAGLWVFAMGASLLNAWLVAHDRFRPLPRWAAGSVTVLVFFFIAREMYSDDTAPIVIIGEFLVFLQLIKLYEQRANRDYAQLLVLSLLLVVAAAISTASLVFGILLIAYLLLSLYCCLLFHLKVEADRARLALTRPETTVNLMTIRQDQRYLSRSMRRLTAIVAAVSISSAIAVFLAFPRGVGAGMLGQLRPSHSLTGFSDQLGFDHIAAISQNQEVVAYVHLWRNDKPVRGQPLLLRGTIYDIYNGANGSPQWQWSRSYSRDNSFRALSGLVTKFSDPEENKVVWTQKIQLQPTGTNVLFAMAGPLSFSADQDLQIRYWPRDGVIVSSEKLNQPVEYTVISSDDLGPTPDQARADLFDETRSTNRRARRSMIDPQIREIALRPEVSGSNEAGPLAAQRAPGFAPSPFDAEIAANIERYLRTNFTYSLDLTDVKRDPQRDPLLQFLTEFKRGHCEYFAGAMTLMCQSLGMQARCIGGFRCDEYNELGDYYVVRQSHAHAWVEVLTSSGWQTFDPTSSRESNSIPQSSGWQQVKHFFNFLEYKWANSVVAYDSDTRDSLVNRMNRTAVNSGASAANAVTDLRQWANGALFWNVSSRILSGLVGLMVCALILAIAWFLLERYKLRRRAARMGLEALPTSDQMRLARKLGFYADLMSLLEREKVVRPRHLTPMEFSDSLSFLPPAAYDTIHRLTRVFYRVRFGEADLQPAQQRRLQTILTRLAPLLSREH